MQKVATLNKHKNTKHKDQTHLCNECEEIFKSKDKLNLHIAKFHQNKNSKQDKQGQAVKYVEQDSSKVKECSICDDTLSTNEEFKSHVSAHLA